MICPYCGGNRSVADDQRCVVVYPSHPYISDDYYSITYRVCLKCAHRFGVQTYLGISHIVKLEDEGKSCYYHQ